MAWICCATSPVAYMTVWGPVPLAHDSWADMDGVSAVDGRVMEAGPQDVGVVTSLRRPWNAYGRAGGIARRPSCDLVASGCEASWPVRWFPVAPVAPEEW